jgi:Flp pilus assembly protein TadG
MKDRRRKNRWMKGSSVVEFALALPIFIILVIGIIEFGWCFFVQHTLQYATREGMRLAIVGRTLTNMSPEASIIYTIRQEASLAVNPNSVLISIYPVGNNFGDPTNWQNTQTAGNRGDYMRVRTRVIHTFFTPLIGSFFPGGTLTIQAEGTFRNES